MTETLNKPEQNVARFRNPKAPLEGSFGREELPPGGTPGTVDMPQDSTGRMPDLHQIPQATTSSPDGHPVNPENNTAVSPETLVGPDPRLPSEGKIFGSPILHAVPPRGGRLQLTPRQSIPDQQAGED
jgi:hypothetical protein